MTLGQKIETVEKTGNCLFRRSLIGWHRLRFLGLSTWPIGIGSRGKTHWARILAYVTGTVDQEYLAAENRILKAQLTGWLQTLGRRAGHARRDRSSTGAARPSVRWPGPIILDPAQLKAATISFTIGFMWKLSDGEMLTRPPASSIARATTGPTAAIVVRAKPCRSVSSH
jgi:hypothetical protein